MRGLVPSLLILAFLAGLPPVAGQESPLPQEVSVTATVTAHGAPIAPITGLGEAVVRVVVECVPPHVSLEPIEVQFRIEPDRPLAVVAPEVAFLRVSFDPEECAVLPVAEEKEVRVTFQFQPNAPAGERLTFRVFAQAGDGAEEEIVSWQETVGHYLHAGAGADQHIHKGSSPFEAKLTFRNQGNSPLIAHVHVVDAGGADLVLPPPTEVAPEYAGGGEESAFLHIIMDAVGTYRIEIGVELVPTIVDPPGESARVSLHFTADHQVGIVGEMPSVPALLVVLLVAGAVALWRRT